MLTHANMDQLMQTIKSGSDAYVYYVCHMAETREGILDEHIYKSVSQFKVVRCKVTDIVNAWFEYENFVENPDDYHKEEVTEYYDQFNTYIHYYTVKNASGSYSLDINPRMPSIIYGYSRIITDRYGVEHDIVEPSPVKEIYTNSPKYDGYTGTALTKQISAGNLDWKYKTLSTTENVDGVEYKYVTSNYYILTLEDYPTIEKPLIYAGAKSSFFMNPEDAFYYIEQLVA